jgi:hypothetical protein
MEEELILVVDSDVELESLKKLEQVPQALLEHNIYHKFGDTKLYYRLDKANNALGQQRHIHVFKDKRGRIQVFSINFDGTKHDGSQRQLTSKEQSALTSLGISVPPDGLLECEEWHSGKMLLFD